MYKYHHQPFSYFISMWFYRNVDILEIFCITDFYVPLDFQVVLFFSLLWVLLNYPPGVPRCTDWNAPECRLSPKTLSEDAHWTTSKDQWLKVPKISLSFTFLLPLQSNNKHTKVNSTYPLCIFFLSVDIITCLPFSQCALFQHILRITNGNRICTYGLIYAHLKPLFTW